MTYPILASGTTQLIEAYSYTLAGLPAAKTLQVNEIVNYGGQGGTATANLESQYWYNNEGKITSVNYPDTVTPFLVTEDQNPYIAGPTYNYSYDSMYRLSGMTDSNNNTIVSNITYNAANQLLTMNYPGASEVRGYNVLNQLTTLSAGSENLTYTYPTGTNNGKVSSMYNAVSGETVAYTYDSLNRLTNATGTIQQTVQWEQGYVYDYFGNLLQKNILGGTLQQPSTQLTVSMTNNQITNVSGMSYDANGNSSTSGMTYDAENRLATAGGLQYAYDGQNKRIWSWNGGLDGSSNPTGYSISMYSPTGQKLATYQLVPQLLNWNPATWMQVTLVSSDQYFGGRRLAVLDQLGSAGTYFPWGEDKGSTDPQNTWSYATYRRDSGTNLDYANNRYYNNAYGRFMTPDPYKSVDSGQPQSWNKYQYSYGDPVNNLDPTGLYPCGSSTTVNSDGVISVTVWDCAGSGGGGGGGDDGFAGTTPPWWQFGGKAAYLKYITDCPPVPQHPLLGPNDASVTANFIMAEAVGAAINTLAATGGLDAATLKEAYLTYEVAPGQSQDYKQYAPSGTFADEELRAFGNYNFGAIGAGLGLSLQSLQFGAGVASTLNIALTNLFKYGILKGPPTGFGSPFTGPPYGDSPQEQAEMAAGFRWGTDFKSGECQAQ